MDHERNDPSLGGGGVEGKNGADVSKNVPTITKTEAEAKHPLVTGIRRGPGGVAKGGLKAELLITIEGLCIDAPIRGRRLRSYEKFCAVVAHRYGIELAPMSQERWTVIVEAAIAAGRSS